MGAISPALHTDRQPPTSIPLRFFLVGFAFLLAVGVAELARLGGTGSGTARIAVSHLLLAGWVCVTIMGAMTQFVPVWSGVPLHSRRLANATPWLVAVGVAGLAASFWLGRFDAIAGFAVLTLSGFWLFVYTLGRTLARARPLDVTEAHFALSLGCLLLVTLLGFVLAVDVRWSLLPLGPIGRENVVSAHATLAAFGVVLFAIFGAIRQLVTMFTQTSFDGIDARLLRAVTVGYPIGVGALVLGRLASVRVLATAGAILVCAGCLGYAVLILRRLFAVREERAPIHTRYGFAGVALAGWAVVAAVSWLSHPLASAGTFGPPGGFVLLAVGFIGFVVFGTLYHVVPFIVWFHAYSDLIGLKRVPTIDQCYSGRLAAIDWWLLATGTVALVAGTGSGIGSLVLVGWILLTSGFTVFVAAMVLVIGRHAPRVVFEAGEDETSENDLSEAVPRRVDPDEDESVEDEKRSVETSATEWVRPNRVRPGSIGRGIHRHRGTGTNETGDPRTDSGQR